MCCELRISLDVPVFLCFAVFAAESQSSNVFPKLRNPNCGDCITDNNSRNHASSVSTGVISTFGAGLALKHSEDDVSSVLCFKMRLLSLYSESSCPSVCPET